MRVAFLSILALSSVCLALPIDRNSRSISGDLDNRDLPILGAIKQAIQNPALTKARLEVVRGLGETTVALNRVASQAGATNNAGVQTLVTQAQSGLAAAKGGVAKIGAAIIAGAKPAVADQATVAQGIIDIDNAVSGMAAAITTPDATLSSDIDNASSSVNTLKDGGQNVLNASGLTLADIGVSDPAL